MTPVKFAEANTRFGPPSDLDDSQCQAIHAYQGQVQQGSVDGSPLIVTAWQPSASELERIKQGQPIYLCFLSGGLPPHYVCTSFQEAVAIA